MKNRILISFRRKVLNYLVLTMLVVMIFDLIVLFNIYSRYQTTQQQLRTCSNNMEELAKQISRRVKD